MLNSVSEASSSPDRRPAGSAVRRTRLSHADRRRQLLGIGLAKLVDKPIQDLSIDEVAAEAGISRGLLFHYFPTKRDFYRACIEAAADAVDSVMQFTFRNRRQCMDWIASLPGRGPRFEPELYVAADPE